MIAHLLFYQNYSNKGSYLRNNCHRSDLYNSRLVPKLYRTEERSRELVKESFANNEDTIWVIKQE